MKTIATSLIISFALIGAAQAGTPRGDIDNVPFQGTYGQADSSTSRAQIQAELQQAKNEGLVAFGDVDNVPFAAQAESSLTRAQVADEVAKTPGATAFGDLNNVPFQG
ncbi:MULTISPECIES: DUF4148 domain-containing protein [unclassified Achromobacter]|uniref:DUF4148 domain-containing protein n=1 Tax=unclassified Achromobacter TaxID=2626865 RepID=UPI000B517EA2|nr:MULTISPECIES: DUF4148 domain-containing protein [unclassified Achromobacter]OWT80894.1 hypothetical protein CEY05_05870 [Achromobacter sp. HZ34]OWT81410.1 hypothetical protein CEY04_05860 [Achromobacter sp. HZ28]